MRAPTSCRHGHEFTPENTKYLPNGQRHCRQCARNWAAANRKGATR